jgi:glycosyltransferase involved in cell wall biosynthesis
MAARDILRQKFGVLGTLIGKHYIALEKNLSSNSDAIVVISEDFEKELITWGLPRTKIFRIENWAPLEDIPELPKNNAWSRENNLTDRVCFLYSGMMGMKHDSNVVWDLAERYADREEVAIVVVSHGLGASWLRQKVEKACIKNLYIFDFQPYERLPEVLASGDVLLALLTSDAGTFCVPSKVLSYLCAGRPILASAPEHNLITATIRGAQAGFCAEPYNRSDFLRLADVLLENSALRCAMGGNARAYAEENFRIGEIATKFERVIWQVCRY